MVLAEARDAYFHTLCSWSASRQSHMPVVVMLLTLRPSERLWSKPSSFTQTRLLVRRVMLLLHRIAMQAVPDTVSPAVSCWDDVVVRIKCGVAERDTGMEKAIAGPRIRQRWLRFRLAPSFESKKVVPLKLEPLELYIASVL